MADVTALLETRDCSVHACAKEADGPDGLCEEHRREPRPKGPEPGVWCPTCKTRTHPNERTGRCLWCDTQLTSDSAPSSERPNPEPARPHVAPDSLKETRRMAGYQGSVCKIDGCDQPPVARFSFYAGLCSRHRDEARAARNGDKTPVSEERATRAPAPADVAASPSEAGPPEAPPRIADQARRARRPHPLRARHSPAGTPGRPSSPPRSTRPRGRLTRG